MHLRYLEIQGFKSFPDKTKIQFDEPYTAIVGPNGSGKSNISDAIRWVLGEQSTKSLRGGKMEDVIFGGTQMRKPMGFAQVSLCLDNTDTRLPDVGDEIVVSRRYYRSGDSEYLVNGATVRLRDVREMFMDTGLGRDGYSIIGQGRIAEIVAAKSDERRELFEEASGIAKFRFRKNEAHRKLEQAEDNLSRLRDIIDELADRIEPLTQQSEKAKKFLELSDQRRSLEITLYCDTIERTRETMLTQDEKISIAAQDYNEIEARLQSLGEEMESIAGQNRQYNEEIERCNADILRINAEVARIESEIAVLQNDRKHADEQIAIWDDERAGLSTDGSGLLAEVEARLLAVEQKKAELETLDRLITDTETELAALLERAEQSDLKHGETVKKLAALQTEVTDLRVENVAAAASVDALETRAATLDEQLLALETRHTTANNECTKTHDYYEDLQKDLDARDNQIKGYELKLSGRKQKLEQLNAALEKQDYEIQDLLHKAKILEDMDKNLDGFSPGVRKVIEAANNRALPGVIGTVASLIHIKAGNEIAIETALGLTAQNIVVRDESAAKQGIRYLKDNKAGRATFLPLDTIKPSRFDARERLQDDGIVGLASDLVRCDDRYRDIISSLLGRIVVAESLDAASVSAKKMGYRYRVVTLDGQVINAGGSYTGGYTAKQGGVFTRKQEIDKIQARVQDLQKAASSAREQRDTVAAEVSALKAELTALHSEQITGNEDRIRAEAVLARATAERDSSGEAINDAQAELAAIAASRHEKNLIISGNEGKISVLDAEIVRLEQSAGDETQSGDVLLERRAELSALLGEHKIARVEKQRDIESIEQAIAALQQRGDAAGDRMANIAAMIAEVRQQNMARQTEIADAQAKSTQLRETAAQCKQDIETMIRDRAAAEQTVTQNQATYGDIAKQREEIGREIARLEERKVSLQSDFDAAVSRLWEEYELTRPEAEKLCVPFNSITELRQQVGSLRAKIKALGTVNVGAIEELLEVTERYTFLSEQVNDVERSKEELLQLIAQLEQEMTTIFGAKFTEINNRFRTVFVELFGGGSANLSLTDETNILESGIEIDVQPPGKVIKNLAALSGGEQALVAIALYFSILAVNPSPFCVLDEIDSALDEANVNRFAAYLRRVVHGTQIVTITHRRGTMEAADILYGVTMQEEGVSKMLKLGVEEAQLVVSQ